MPDASPLSFRPVTSANAEDMARFSREHGRFGYCSCMRWRLRSSGFERCTRQEREAKLEDLVHRDVPVGVLAYDGELPVGLCSVAPRDTYAALLVSRRLPPVDDVPVWSIVCFFVDRKHRHKGVRHKLLKAAVEYAVFEGAPAVEGYPIPADAVSYTYMGTPALFLDAGFRDITPPGQDREVMRYTPA